MALWDFSDLLRSDNAIGGMGGQAIDAACPA
jgi:hypothetical protein